MGASSTTGPVLGRTKWKRRLAIGGVVLPLTLWFLPALIAHSPALGWIVRSATRDVRGTVSVTSASFGWFSPVVLRDVSVRDAAGEPLLAIGKVESERTLLGVLLNSSNPGRFKCTQTTMEVVFTKEASGHRTNRDSERSTDPCRDDTAPALRFRTGAEMTVGFSALFPRPGLAGRGLG